MQTPPRASPLYWHGTKSSATSQGRFQSSQPCSCTTFPNSIQMKTPAARSRVTTASALTPRSDLRVIILTNLAYRKCCSRFAPAHHATASAVLSLGRHPRFRHQTFPFEQTREPNPCIHAWVQECSPTQVPRVSMRDNPSRSFTRTFAASLITSGHSIYLPVRTRERHSTWYWRSLAYRTCLPLLPSFKSDDGMPFKCGK